MNAVIVPVTGVIGAPTNLFLSVAMPLLIWPSLSFLRPMPSPMRLASRRWIGRRAWREQKQQLSKLNVRWIVSDPEAPMLTEASICVAIADARR